MSVQGKRRLGQILSSTLTKLKDFSILSSEYDDLEQVGPSPGRPGGQHDSMVRMGLCQAAVNHKEENRYCNLFPFDENRVILGGDNDYINASWVSVQGMNFKYILTMGPLHPNSYSLRHKTDFGENESLSTCEQFWKMIDQTECEVIVMLCTIQKGFTGCGEYLPLKEGQEQKHGEYLVKAESLEDRGGGSIVRTLSLSGPNSSKSIIHMQFTNWPNYEVARDVGELGSFMRQVTAVCRGKREPLVVHCSGGVGRSGAFTAIHSMHNLLLKANDSGEWGDVERYLDPGTGAINMKPLVWMLRETRHPWMVEGIQQYELIYQTVVEIMKGLDKMQSQFPSDI